MRFQDLMLAALCTVLLVWQTGSATAAPNGPETDVSGANPPGSGAATASEAAELAENAGPAPGNAPAPAGTDAADTSRAVEVNETTAAKVSQMTCKSTTVTGSRVQKRKVCTTPDSEDRTSNWVQSQQDRGARESTISVNGRGG